MRLRTSPVHPSRPARRGRKTRRTHTLALLTTTLSAALVGGTITAQEADADIEEARCSVCAGWSLSGDVTPTAVAEKVAELGTLDDDAFFYVSWDASASGEVTADQLRRDVAKLAAENLRPWLRVDFDIEYPVTPNAATFDQELERLTQLVAAAGDDAVWELAWPRIDEPLADPRDFAFAVKRAAVAVTGAAPEAKVALRFGDRGSLNIEQLRSLYAEEIAAYVDGAVLASSADGALELLRDALLDLDPESDVVQRVQVDGSPLGVLPAVADRAHRGANVTLIELQTDAPVTEQAQPMILLADELGGDVTPDPYATPATSSGATAWSFVRGEDLALRVIAARGDADQIELEFSDRTLSAPTQIDPATGDANDLFSGRRTRGGFALTVRDAPRAALLGIERPGIKELIGDEGVEEDVTVADTRQMPVEEILRRLQAFEDDQRRKLDNYTAINAQSLRFVGGSGVQAIDVQFEGAFFFEQDKGYDWAWEDLYINGVKWRRGRIPEIPLIQPEKASNLPLEINFTREYRYRLRGTETVRGRDCWVVDFEPARPLEAGETLFQGTVWVDRELYARVRTRANQLGLRGDVLSNDETLDYEPLDATGESIDWTLDAYYLPTRTVGQQIFSILNSTTVVEREVTLSNISINPENFQEQREAKMATEVTMVSETDNGVRYLKVDKDGNRVVQEELDPSRMFLVGGAFYDESQDFPIPLGGINWINFDWRGTGTQTNLFVAGPLILADIANPSVRGSRWDLGIDAFALAIAGTDSIFRGDQEAPQEDVESLRPNIDITLGRPFGTFWKMQLEYSLGFNRFSRADDTAEEFVLPEDHLDHQFSLLGRYNRRGWRARAGGTYVLRSDWEEWGLPDNTDFDPDNDQYTLWQAGLAKIWHLPKFTKIGAEIEYVGGENLDRFSKYQFGFFSDIRVHGYRSDRVRAEEAYAAHLSYGINIGDVFRIDLIGDAAWATDEASQLEDEFLAGIGLVGTVLGPWGTIINMDIGFPVAGPDEGVSAFIAFLKLFNK